MKFKNIETLAKKVAKKLGSDIISVFNHDNCFVVRFDNAYIMCLSKDDSWFTITDYTSNESKNVMKCYLDSYRTQKEFFADMIIYLNQYKETSEGEITDSETAETTEHDTETIETFPQYLSSMLNENILAEYGYFLDKHKLIKKADATDKTYKPLDTKLASFIYNWNVDMLTALYDGEIASILCKPNVRSAHTIECDLNNKNPTKLNLFRQLQQNLKACYECKEYSSILHSMLLLEDQCENLSFCGKNTGAMFFTKVHDAMCEMLK